MTGGTCPRHTATEYTVKGLVIITARMTGEVTIINVTMQCGTIEVLAGADNVADVRFLEAMVESGVDRRNGLGILSKRPYQACAAQFSGCKNRDGGRRSGRRSCLLMKRFLATTCTCTRINDIVIKYIIYFVICCMMIFCIIFFSSQQE